MYNRTYVNNNGLLSFSREIPEMDPVTFPSYRNEDLIAPLWTDLHDGVYYYQEYTTGYVLTRATEDIRRYYPGRGFNASWAFVATWDFVKNKNAIQFQVVLISDDNFSFILMNYGDISEIDFPVEAGYDTVGSTHYFVIPGSNHGNLIPNLKTTSNVNVPGRWAFSANQDTVIGLQMRVSSYLNLSENVTFLLEKLKYELVRRNLTSDVKLTVRSVKKINSIK
ncbi:sushi, nidogen and EGF-like domain-containing protein 1 [Triplophysa dalaica]|uniref:sushi, nidogen and EGF-like domain-containing protein 1 n=1 Tax=Triplophysa dalaica TaxID=1582913 RepID=UPI0024DFF813|nr:sushi, nidogen and EGF-like domain-containing protein 1 [Triplophysa dalaica]